MEPGEQLFGGVLLRGELRNRALSAIVEWVQLGERCPRQMTCRTVCLHGNGNEWGISLWAREKGDPLLWRDWPQVGPPVHWEAGGTALGPAR